VEGRQDTFYVGLLRLSSAAINVGQVDIPPYFGQIGNPLDIRVRHVDGDGLCRPAHARQLLDNQAAYATHWGIVPLF